MQITLRGSALSLASTAMDDRENVRLPALPSARELRRARLIRHLSRRQLGFLALHVTLGVLGWSALALASWGVYALIR
ncbi:hypothetical protein [Silanimonas sp.]|jgi:hypothetical protein|uniref:hypothetical protein n=1 Tax=Silanimonas sp. TaxID=1929290 RepID=UPI0022C5990F|nr:hypothetical protein [Silanimonas sp.]MCZ8114001.1 hypothetical protein [Silanimonas sp.]